MPLWESNIHSIMTKHVAEIIKINIYVKPQTPRLRHITYRFPLAETQVLYPTRGHCAHSLMSTPSVKVSCPWYAYVHKDKRFKNIRFKYIITNNNMISWETETLTWWDHDKQRHYLESIDISINLEITLAWELRIVRIMRF